MKKLFYSLLTICLVCLSSIPTYAKEVNDIDKQAIEKALENQTITKEEYNSVLSILPKNVPVERVYNSRNTLPSSYDPRLTGKVTPVKSQLPYGSCWSYGAIAVAESALIHQGLEDNTIDLSEMQYMYKYWKTECPEETYEEAFDKGAGLVQVWRYMSQGIGPAFETDFDTPQDYTGKTYTEEELNAKVYDLDTIYYAVYNENDTNSVKQLIQNYGGATFTYYSDNGFYLSNPVSSTDPAYNNTGDSTYYCPFNVTAVNHMIEVVGWDDNYPKENFFVQPENNGAWLCKNSWGEAYYGNHSYSLEDYLSETGEELAAPTGYYWISYEEYSGMNIAMVGTTFAEKNTQVTEIQANSEVEVPVGATYTINPVVLPETATNKEVSYVSSNPSIATVTPNGVVKGVKAGTCTITITSNDILDAYANESWATKEITVTVKDRTIRILNESIELEYQETAKIETEISLGEGEVVYSSSSPAVAKVDENGVITGGAYGKATITATIKDTNICDTIEVVVAMKEIYCDEDVYSLRYHPTYTEEERTAIVSYLYMRDKRGNFVEGYTTELVNDSVFELIDDCIRPKSVGTGYIKVSYCDSYYTNGKTLTTTVPVVVSLDQYREESITTEATTTEKTTSASTTEKRTTATTEKRTEVTTERVTETTTEKVTEATTEKVTTEKRTEATTEKRTEATTEKRTEATTEQRTEATTEKVTTKEENTTTETITTTENKKEEKVTVSKTKWVKVKKSGTKLTLKWKKISGISSYKLQVSTNKKFKKKDTKTYTVSKKTTSKTIKIKKNKTYYVRIQTVKKVKGKNYTSKWVNKTVKK